MREQLEGRRFELALRLVAAKAAEAEASQREGDGAADGEEAGDAEAMQSPKELQKQMDRLGRLIARIAAAEAAVQGDAESVEQHAKAAKLERVLHARWLQRAGDVSGAIRMARQAVKKGPGEVRPLATLVEALWAADERDEALEQFAKLREVAADADLETPLLAGLATVAEAAGVEGDWRQEAELAGDLGQRPPLDQLGPFQWQPSQAPAWQALNPNGQIVSDKRYSGRPRLVIFYLGFGCLHCVEQLHAFSPRAEAFREAGIELVAISTESLEQLRLGLGNFEEELAIPLLADPEHEVFKRYRCWDDFEDQPLHGTFLIDGEGRVRWQDISYEPFTEVDFLLEEAQRLLAHSVDEVSGSIELDRAESPEKQ
jgi:peroxiredoxin